MKPTFLLVVASAAILLCCIHFAVAATAPRCDAQRIGLSETKLDAPIKKFVWLNNSDGDVEAIFILTRGRVVWRSTDEGKTFQRLDARLPPPIDDIIVTANYKQLYFLQFRGKLWTTQDQGENDFKLASQELLIQSVRAHPTQPSWALAQVVSPACFPSPREGCSWDLYLTQDFGRSWQKKADFVAEEQYDWGGAGSNGVPMGNVFYVNFPEATSRSNQVALAQRRFDQVFQRTSDLFKTHDTPRPHAVAFKYYAETVVIAEAISANDDSLLALYGSHDGGNTFGKCLFPTKLDEKSYHVVDLSEDTAFVSVDHEGGAYWATTYISDSLISKFSTVSNYTRRDRGGKSDFRRIKALEGIYVTNKYVITDENDPVNEDTPLVSSITFDKGGQWHPLPPPAKDLNGQSPCSGCNLHLVRFTSTRRGNKALHSRTDTPGILLATGSVGPFLQDEPDKVNTYLSRDAGMTWSQVASGEYVYEMGDYGSLIVMTKANQVTSNLLYTWDQGLSKTECAMSNLQLEVKEIYNSPSGKDLSFIVSATVLGSDNYVIHVDFTNADARNCDPNADYETWSPSDAHDDHCLLGQKITYTRRKQDSKCFNSVDYERPNQQVSYCACARQDFQCDYCFESVKNDPGKCILDEDCPTNPLARPTPCIDKWNKTQGYRLVPGDKCTTQSSDFEKYAALPVKCSGGDGDGSTHNGGGGLSGGAIVGILFGVFAALAGIAGVVGYILYRVNPEFHDYVSANMPKSLFSSDNKPYPGSGSHEYSRLSTAEPQSLLEDLEGDNTGLDDDLLEDEAPELDAKSISSFTNQGEQKKDKDPLSNNGEDSLI